jgi:leader peptidase (prepilin peptidase)/N-methyltransferase
MLALDMPAAVPAYLYLAAITVALALIDIDVKRLPNVITLPSYVVAPVLLLLPAAVHDRWGDYLRALLGLVALYAFYFALMLVGDMVYGAGGAMGFGDVKLAGILGLYLAWLGWSELVVGGFLGFLVGAVFGVLAVTIGGARWKTKVPYGPHMLAGALLSIFLGRALADLYLGTLSG